MVSELSPYATHVFAPQSTNNSWSNLFEFIPENARVLDVGCSTGNFGATLIQERGCHVTGIDLNPADVEEARAHLSEAFVMDIDEIGAVESLGKFDVIIFADVLEHLVDPRATLREVRQCLTDHGKVIYSIPNMAHLSTRLDLLGGDFPYTETGLLDKTHLHFYDRVEIDNLFADAGFDIIEERPVVVEYPQLWVRDRLAQLGLSATPEFHELMRETESQVFQYVGAAVPTNRANPSSTRQRAIPNDEIIGYVAALLEHIAHLEKQFNELHTEFMRARKHPIVDLCGRASRRVSRLFQRA